MGEAASSRAAGTSPTPVNDEAANAIAEALTITGALRRRWRLRRPTRWPSTSISGRRTSITSSWLADVKRAVEPLPEQALERASRRTTSPTILAACARARARIAFFGGEGAAKMLELAVQAAERAVAGAPELGEVLWVALATVRLMGGDAPGAVRAAVTALGKSKGLAPAHEILGRILIEAGRSDRRAHPSPGRPSPSTRPEHRAPAFEIRARVRASSATGPRPSATWTIPR